MVDYSSASFPPPQDWQEFERCCRVLFECLLSDPNTQMNGRSGQPQHGVDVFGRRGGPSGPWVGIQCKGKENGTYRKSVTKKELRREVKKAYDFKPLLSEFILATTAPDDAEIQQEARLITEENEKMGNNISVAVWGWGDLQSRINQHPNAIRAFFPDASPFIDETLSGQARIESKLDEVLATLNTCQDQSIVAAFYSSTVNTVESSVTEKSQLEAHLHEEIDTYRDLIVNGKSKTGMELLEKLKGKIWETASNRIKFRITTNIGAALLNLGDEKNAADIFLAAIVHDPFDKIGMANVALAYLLKGDSEKAIKAANDAMQQDSENDNAAGYLIQAYITDQNIIDPFSLIPENLWKKRGVIAGVISFWRKRGMPEWHKMAHEAAALFPEADELKRAAAEANIDIVGESKWNLLGQGGIPDQYFKNLNDTVSILQTIWDKIKIDENKVDISLSNNLAMAYRILGNNEDAAKVIDEALAKAPDDTTLIKLRAILYIALKQKDDAIKLLLKKRGIDPECIILTAELLLDKDPEKARDLLSEIGKPIIADEHYVAASLISIESYHREGNIEKALAQAKSLAAEHPQKIEVIIVLSSIQRECGDVSADETLLHAKHLINENTRFVDRFFLARGLHNWGDHEEAVRILDGYVDLRRDTPALQLFLVALKDSDRRRQAYECINKLPADIIERPWYLKMKAGINIARGDYKSAEKDLDKYFLLCPDDLALRHVWIALCYRRKEGTAKIKTFLESAVEMLKGYPVDRMQLAIYLERFGFEERALELGYQILLENPENPEIHVKYIALLLQPNKTSNINLNVNEVAPDTVFVIENTLGENNHYLIEKDNKLRLDARTIAPDHEIAKKVIGLRVGDSFTVAQAIGPPENWYIKSIKHKYLDTLHRCTEDFNMRFPSYQGFQKVRFDPNAPNTILEHIKARHDAYESIFNKFDKAPIPLSIFAEGLGIDDIKTLQGIIETGRKFRVCIGTFEERNIAFKAIAYNAKRGCVVDALTFFIIRRLGLENTIIEVCGKIGMTESSIDVFRQRCEEIELHGGKPFLVISYQKGQFIREEITAERLRVALDEITNDLSWIEDNCDILPAESNLVLPTEFSSISKRLGRNIFDSILAAHSSQRILLSEDYLYRTLATEFYNLQSTWLQPLLMIAHDKHKLTTEKHDNAIVYMLKSGFDFISVDSNILLRTASSATDLRGNLIN
jgi:tetratricopeptide (TPR) repeat protein